MYWCAFEFLWNVCRYFLPHLNSKRCNFRMFNARWFDFINAMGHSCLFDWKLNLFITIVNLFRVPYSRYEVNTFHFVLFLLLIPFMFVDNPWKIIIAKDFLLRKKATRCSRTLKPHSYVRTIGNCWFYWMCMNTTARKSTKTAEYGVKIDVLLVYNLCTLI